MLYYGPVRAPENARKGKAIMRVAMPPTSAFASFATDIPVVIE